MRSKLASAFALGALLAPLTAEAGAPLTTRFHACPRLDTVSDCLNDLSLAAVRGAKADGMYDSLGHFIPMPGTKDVPPPELPNVAPLSRPSATDGISSVRDASAISAAMTVGEAATPFDSAKELAAAATADTKARADEAEKKASALEKIANFERAFADQLAGSYDVLRAYVRPRLASGTPAERQEAASMLAKPASPPPEFSRAYAELRLATNQDVIERAPAYLRNLAGDADRGEAAAEQLRDDASLGYRAASGLGGFERTLGDRKMNLESIPEGAAMLAAGATLPQPRAGAGRREGSLSASAVTSSAGLRRGVARAPVTESFESGTREHAGRNPAAAGDRADTALETGAGSGASAGLATESASLRDALRRRLAASAQSRGTPDTARREAATQPAPAAKSSFSSLFGDTAEHAETESVDRLPTGERGFRLSGAETERAIAKLLGNADGSLGSADLSLFERMRSFLKRCQSEKRVSSGRH